MPCGETRNGDHGQWVGPPPWEWISGFCPMRLNASPGIITAALGGLAIGYLLHEVRAAVRERHAIDTQLILLLDLLARRSESVRIVKGRPGTDAASPPSPD